MNLSIKIFISLVLAVIVGLIAGEPALPFINWWIAPIGTIFINLIKMMIVPVVLCSLVVGMTSLGDTTKLGRIGIKTILLYLVTTAIAIVIGFGVAGLAQPERRVDRDGVDDAADGDAGDDGDQRQQYGWAVLGDDR
mgnify:CR=1 FL=1